MQLVRRMRGESVENARRVRGECVESPWRMRGVCAENARRGDRHAQGAKMSATGTTNPEMEAEAMDSPGSYT